MKTCKKIYLNTAVLLILVILSGGASAIAAQSLPIPTQIPDLEEQVEGTMKPQYPSPGETVNISLEAYGTDLNRALITWSVNGTVSIKAIGQKTFTVKALKLGEKQTVTATILPIQGVPIVKIFYINPQSIDIVWQSDTYTPPFYRGKAMFSPQAKVTIVALPNLINGAGSLVAPGNLTYKWKKDFVVQGSKSGYGIQTFSYKGDILMQPVNIGLEVSLDGGNTASTYIDMKPTEPEIGIYEDSPLYGILWNRELALGLDFGNTAERNVSVIPYFFGVESKSSPELSYIWSINGSEISVPENQNSMTFRNSENLEGRSQIGVLVSNNLNLLESASGGLIINFKKTAKPSLL